MPLPTFLVIGAMKGGTSSLWRYLSAHPQVFMSANKEPDFFVERTGWKRGLDWYRSLFDEAGDATAIGEASTSYTKAPMNPGVPERIASVLPDVRMIYLVRHPIERMVSHYIHRRSDGSETKPIERAFRDRPNYIDASRYAYQLDQFLRVFARDRILIITSESLRDDRVSTMARVESFIGVDPAVEQAGLQVSHHRSADKRIRTATLERARQRPLFRAARKLAPLPARRLAARLMSRNASTEDVTISDDLRNSLVEQLRPDVERLRSFMDETFDGWGIA